MRRGQKHTAETLARMSAAHKNPSPETRAKLSAALRGRHFSDEHRAKISAALRGNKHGRGCRGRKCSPETRAKIAATSKGRMVSPETRAKISAANRGQKRSAKTCAKISTAKKGKRRPPFSAEWRANMSVANCGPKNPAWLGGISREPYGWEWNDELREEVRRRDGHKCQKCGVPQAECRRKLDVHHVDYDKKNSDPVNLTSLCGSCNAKVNANRTHWTAVFQAMAIARDIAALKEREG